MTASEPQNLTTVTAPPPSSPERDLIVAVVAQTLTDATGRCAPETKHVCERSDAILAARDPYLLDLAGLVGLEHAVERIGRMTPCCTRVRQEATQDSNTASLTHAAPIGGDRRAA